MLRQMNEHQSVSFKQFSINIRTQLSLKKVRMSSVKLLEEELRLELVCYNLGVGSADCLTDSESTLFSKKPDTSGATTSGLFRWT